MTVAARCCAAILLLALSLAANGQDSPPVGVYLGDLSWPVAEERLARTPIVVIPFGAGAKEHGPHLPMNADQVVLEYLLEQAVQHRNVIVAPPILHGWLPAFREFPGTEVADANVFADYVQNVAMSLVKSGAQRLVFLNTGIAKASGLPISIVAREVRVATGVPTLVVSWDDLETEGVAELQTQAAGGHGDEIETSINLYLQPEKVDMSRAVTDYGDRSPQDYGGYRPGFFSRSPGDPDFSTTGIYGDPTAASPEKGAAALRIMTAEWLAALAGFADVPRTRQE